MKVLSNRAGVFLTGTEIADAVQCYDLALARVRTVDLVDIPATTGTKVSRATFLVGWKTHTLAVEAEDDPTEELTDPGTVIDLYEKAARVGIIRAIPFTPKEVAAMEAVEIPGE